MFNYKLLNLIKKKIHFSQYSFYIAYWEMQYQNQITPRFSSIAL
jgi:hypothetical protein